LILLTDLAYRQADFSYLHRLFYASIFEAPSPSERAGVRSLRFKLRTSPSSLLRLFRRRDLGRHFLRYLGRPLRTYLYNLLLPPSTPHIKECHNKNGGPVHKLIAPSHCKACVIYLHYIPRI
jgi:hypothetical protein